MLKELGEEFYSENGLSVTGHKNITIKNNTLSPTKYKNI